MAEEIYDKKYARLVLILFAAFVVMVMYVETMLIPSLPSIAKQFNVDAAQVSLVLSLYLVSGVALCPIVGKLSDIYGKKKVLMFILPTYAISVALTGFAPSFSILLILRAVQGVGLTIFPLAISLIQEQFPRDQVPKALGIVGAMFGAGAAIGLPLGSLVSNNFGWQVTYHTAVPFVILFSVLIALYVKESRHTQPGAKVDYIGAVGLAAFLGLIVFALSEGSTFGWTSPSILAMFAAGIIILIGLILFERKAKNAVLDFELLSIKNVLNSNLIVLAIGLGFFLAYQTLAYQLESPAPIGYGQSIFLTGVAMVPFAIMSLIVAPIVGQLISRLGAKPFYYIGAVVSIIGFFVASIATSVLVLSLGAAIVGAGLAALNIPNVNTLILSIDRSKTGLATSMNAVFRFLGSALGAPVAGIFIAAFGTKVAFQYSYYTAIAMFLLVIVIAVFSEEVIGKNAVVKHSEKQIIKED